MKGLLAVGKVAGMSVKNCWAIAEDTLEKTRGVEVIYRDMRSQDCFLKTDLIRLGARKMQNKSV